jgi:3'-phosphoadenosine 5'-phosphosulfate sulfotransferase (PAPS reductase)/FAD synthetase
MEKPITYWEKIYLQHSKSDLFKRKVDKSAEVINDFFDLKIKSYGSISAGKDSTAMMHLIYLLDSDFKFVTEKDDMDFPEEIPYIKNLQQKGYNIEIISPDDNLWDEIVHHDFCEDIHSKGTDFSDKYFYGLLKKYQSENNYKGVFL